MYLIDVCYALINESVFFLTFRLVDNVFSDLQQIEHSLVKYKKTLGRKLVAKCMIHKKAANLDATTELGNKM